MFNIEPITSSKQLDCGPTCLKMLLSYYNINIDLEQLIQDCNTSITGCSGKDLLDAGRKYMLDMKAYRMDATELIQQDRPAIIWWKYRHWCIFAGKDENGKVIICNPDRGRYRMSKEVFSSFYTGVALFNGEPISLPEEEIANAADYEKALAKLGVNV